jgi:hypothetical protein
MNYTSITLGELLSSENETIKRNAVGILKALQKKEKPIDPKKCLHLLSDWVDGEDGQYLQCSACKTVFRKR